MRYSKWFPYLFFLTVYCIGYGPYFLMAPLPDFQQDSYIYFWVASLIRDGNIPFPKFTIDVAVGYPVFIWLIKSVFSKTGPIILVQNLLFVGSSLYCIYSFAAYRKAFGWVSAVALSIYAIDNFTIRLNTSLYTDGFYATCLIFVVAQTARCFRATTPFNIALLTFSLLIPSLIRPNGIFIFILVPITALLLVASKVSSQQIYALIISFVLVLIIWSCVNLYFKGIFLPSDPYRLESVYKHIQQSKKNSVSIAEQSSPVNYSPRLSRLQLFVKNLSAFAEVNPSFYFTNMPGRYKLIYSQNIYTDPQQKLFNRFPVDSAAPGLKDYLFAEFIDQQPSFSKIDSLCDINGSKRNYWMYLNHVLYKIHGIFIRNILWVLLYVFVGFYYCYVYLKSKFTDTRSLFIITLFLIHLISIAFISIGHGSFQTRYVHATEPFFMLAVFIGLYSIFIKIQKKAF